MRMLAPPVRMQSTIAPSSASFVRWGKEKNRLPNARSANRLANTPAQIGNGSSPEAVIGKLEQPQRVARISPAGDRRLDPILRPRKRFCASGLDELAAQPGRDAKMQF